jgi:hypothetical protein
MHSERCCLGQRSCLTGTLRLFTDRSSLNVQHKKRQFSGECCTVPVGKWIRTLLLG